MSGKHLLINTNMEKKHSSCPLGACEKFFKAITFRKVHRIFQHSQPPVPVNSHPAASTPIVKTHDSPLCSKPEEAAQHHKTPKTNEAAEVIPFSASLPAPPNEKAKPAALQAMFKNGHAATAVPKTEPLSHVIQVEKVKTKPKVGTTDRVQPGNTLVPSYGRVAKVPSEIENQPPQVNRQEGGKSGVNIDDRCTEYINRASIKIRATSNVGHDGKGSLTSVAGEDKYSNKDHFSDYINRAKLKIRAMPSFVGGRSDSIK